MSTATKLGYEETHRVVHVCGEPSVTTDEAEVLAREKLPLPCCRCREDRPVTEFCFQPGPALV